MNSLILEHFDHYSLLTINRPQALNALNAEVFSELDEVISSPLPATTRLLVIRGAGEKAFAAGADITEFANFTGDQAQMLSKRGQVIFQKLADSTIPTLALINGYALGGGLELALACQIRVVTKSAVLGLPELNLALIPGYGGTQRLPLLIGKGKARYYTLTSENMTGEKAVQLGAADFLVEDLAEGEAFVQAFAKKMSFKSSVSLGLAQEAIRSSDQAGGFELESLNFKKAFEADDMKEGVGAFLEKRKPVFKNS
ncbi:MAG TPA: enoyl-CoA hydratase-related protein [Catalimonadaceae bacterium]|nr:enoyl-CoA hydratase-related protein [Catalimonadaceae bacterium]